MTREMMRPMLRVIFTALLLITGTSVRAEIAVQDITTPKGIRAWLVEDQSIPFTALEIRFQGGGAQDPADKRGATNLMTGLLEEGAGDLDARAFTRSVEELAAQFSFDASDDSVSVSARFLTENRDQAVALLRTALVQPRFDADALDRVRGQVLSGLRSDATDPSEIAGRVWDGLLFGDHPYAQDLRGTLDSVASLTRDDIVAAHKAALVRDRMYVAAVGDISAAELAALLDGLLGDLPATGPARPAPVEPAFPGGIHVTDFDTPQSVVLFGQPGIDRDDPDFFAAFILNHILGGGSFESRLMQEVREKRGLTYGVSSYLVDRDLAYWWGGGLNSANGKVAEAVSVIRDEWRRMATDGVTDAELADAKTYLTGEYPLRFDGNGPIASILVGMQMQGLPISYITARNDLVNAVTRDDISRVAARLMDPAKLTFVVVGKPEGLPQN